MMSTWHWDEEDEKLYQKKQLPLKTMMTPSTWMGTDDYQKAQKEAHLRFPELKYPGDCRYGFLLGWWKAKYG